MFFHLHPTGSSYVREDIRCLHEANLLDCFFTTLGYSKEAFFAKIPFSAKIKNNLRRRAYDLPPSKIKAYPRIEIYRLLFGQRFYSVDRIYEYLDQKVSQVLKTLSPEALPKAIFGYEDGCLKTFQQAHKQRLTCFYHLPIAHWEYTQKILAEEGSRYPNWECTLRGRRDSEEKLRRKSEELKEADCIICPSQFVKDSLPSFIQKNKPCWIIPYGAPPVISPANKRPPAVKLKLLFVGALSQRKGLADLFSAIHLLKRNDIELTLLGSLCAPLKFYRSQLANFIYKPPCSNEEVLTQMSQCDVLVLPSLVEGRAIVQLEALQSGLPLIVTPHTGGEDLIEEGKTGFTIPIRSPRAIAEKIDWFADHRKELPFMREAALQKAKECSWYRYRQTLVQTIKTHLAL